MIKDLERLFKIDKFTDAKEKLDIEELKLFFAQMQIYRASIKEIITKFEILDDEFKTKYDYNPIHHIESRLKSPESIFDKLLRKNLEPSVDVIKSELKDIAGVRVICNYKDDIEHIANLLIRQEDITLIRKRDYITNPKPSGYQSLHLIVEVPIFLIQETVPTPVEIQIRTIAMDFWASLEHKLKYKMKDEIPKELKQKLYECAMTVSKIDDEMQEIHINLKDYNNN